LNGWYFSKKMFIFIADIAVFLAKVEK